jgi:hypothetical protein
LKGDEFFWMVGRARCLTPCGPRQGVRGPGRGWGRIEVIENNYRMKPGYERFQERFDDKKGGFVN